jgi:hypothetical protein
MPPTDFGTFARSNLVGCCDEIAINTRLLLPALLLTVSQVTELNTQTTTTGGLTGVVTESEQCGHSRCKRGDQRQRQGHNSCEENRSRAFIDFLSDAGEVHTDSYARRLSKGESTCNHSVGSANHSDRRARLCTLDASLVSQSAGQ